MHRSRLAGFIIDCQTQELETASRFWTQALGMKSLGHDGDAYMRLDATARDLVVEVQSVRHDSRVHIDIETDDVDAEAARLESLGAKRVSKTKTWWVMEAPTGQRFCIVQAKRSLEGAAGVTTWGG